MCSSTASRHFLMTGFHGSLIGVFHSRGIGNNADPCIYEILYKLSYLTNTKY
jgi:hypothetical protein